MNVFHIVFVYILCSLTQAASNTMKPFNQIEKESYGFMWWAHGFAFDPMPEGRILNIQTDAYALSIDAPKADIVRFGRIRNPGSMDEVLSPKNQDIETLPPSRLELSIVIDGVRYRCTGHSGKIKQPTYKYFPFRIIDSGRFVQRFDILDLVFVDDNGNVAEVDTRLEFLAWPEEFILALDITPRQDFGRLEIDAKLAGNDAVWLNAGKQVDAPRAATLYRCVGGYSTTPALSQKAVSVTSSLPVGKSAAGHYFTVQVPTHFFKSGRFPESIEKAPLTLTNDTDEEQPIGLLFSTEFEPKANPNLIGSFPLLTDRQGKPLGIEIQISKNWHKSDLPIPPVYDGSWFRGYTVFRIKPQSKIELLLNLINGVWGDVPAVSHSQLCLVGWGGHQLWEQVAIGNWNEAICYDPDIGLGRAFIDDMRPLLVYAMGSEKEKKWTWTHNVGGGDFLVYDDAEGKRQKLIGLKNVHRKNGPNLTECVYTGITQDGAIAAHLVVSTPRSDDINRSFHTFRYDVLKPVRFSRLAFYQLGADNYNINDFNRIAIGNADGLAEEWTPDKGGKKYHRRYVPCKGQLPWFSIHDTAACCQSGKLGGPMANRGLIVRRYAARLGGRDIAVPYASFYGTEDNMLSSNIELTVPDDIDMLLPGDFVEARVDVLVLPQYAADYYGPNESLKAALAKDQNTWRLVHREAIGNDLKIQSLYGTLMQAYPVVVKVDAQQQAQLAITGGVGYVPITFAGVRREKGYKLCAVSDGVETDIHDNENYQLNRSEDGTYQVTYNIRLDAVEGVVSSQTLRFSVSPQAQNP